MTRLTAIFALALQVVACTTQPVDDQLDSDDSVTGDAGAIAVPATDAGAPSDAGVPPSEETVKTNVEVVEMPPEPPVVEAAPAVFRFRVSQRTELVQQVLDRWTAATCLKMEIADDGPHSITFGASGISDGRYGQLTGPWAAARIRVRDVSPGSGRDWFTDRVRTVILAHELGHLLARTNGHIGDTVLDDDALNPENDIIPTKLLNRVCSKQACPCFNPEEEPRPYEWRRYSPPAPPGDAGPAPEITSGSDAGIVSDAS